jgi:hypothetical protein
LEKERSCIAGVTRGGTVSHQYKDSGGNVFASIGWRHPACKGVDYTLQPNRSDARIGLQTFTDILRQIKRDERVARRVLERKHEFEKLFKGLQGPFNGGIDRFGIRRAVDIIVSVVLALPARTCSTERPALFTESRKDMIHEAPPTCLFPAF